jgi:hypothetical protein
VGYISFLLIEVPEDGSAEDGGSLGSIMGLRPMKNNLRLDERVVLVDRWR